MNSGASHVIPWWIRGLGMPLFAMALLSQSYIDYQLDVSFGPRTFNLPVADLCALTLLVLASPFIWADAHQRSTMPLPGIPGYALFLVACVMSIGVSIEPAESLHHVLRKPLFYYLVYGIGFSWWVARGIHPSALTWLLLIWATTCAGLSLISSVDRIATGGALWHNAIDGLTPNHKALTVALAGGLPLLLSVPTRTKSLQWGRMLAFILVGLAIIASASKTAIVVGLVFIGLLWPRQRPFSFQPKRLLLCMGIGLGLAYYAPLWMKSKAMLDAARSRHSLNERSLEMFAHNPLFGSGSGMGVHYEQVTWPHYRVNGTDTHGVIQKVASETGIVGLTGYALFAGGTGWALLRRRKQWEDPNSTAALGTWITLHISLLLSTETFSPTHWVPFAVAWGIAHRIPHSRHARSNGPYLPPPKRR